MESRTAFLALGTNLGDKIANLRKAISLFDNNDACTVTAASSMYLTKPIGFADQPEFINMVIRVQTTLTPTALMKLCSDIEQKLGRKRTIKWGPRVIDIDILLYEGVNIDEARLTIPHPRMLERAFVLVPLAEIAPDLKLPGGVSSSEAAGRTDRTGVVLYRE